MANELFATQWGSPSASKQAFLVHGITSSSQVWNSVGNALAAEGYRVLAPDLLNHGRARQTSDYSFDAMAENLLPFFQNDNEYDLLVGWSLGGLVVLKLLHLIPLSRPLTVILVDPPFERDEKETAEDRSRFLRDLANVPTIKDLKALNPLWTEEDCIFKIVAAQLCKPATVSGIFERNGPWSLTPLFGTVPSNAKIIVLAADPTLHAIFRSEWLIDFPAIEIIEVKGATHSIPLEFPEFIVDTARAKVETLKNSR